MKVDVDELLAESQAEGFLFITRLLVEYEKGTNMFDRPGEVLYGAFTEEGSLVAVCGLNQEQNANWPSAGRLRRFYVRKQYRRLGIGKRLVEQLIADAEVVFNSLVLYTDTTGADDFYRSLGFTQTEQYQEVTKVTHYLRLKP